MACAITENQSELFDRIVVQESKPLSEGKDYGRQCKDHHS